MANGQTSSATQLLVVSEAGRTIISFTKDNEVVSVSHFVCQQSDLLLGLLDTEGAVRVDVPPDWFNSWNEFAKLTPSETRFGEDDDALPSERLAHILEVCHPFQYICTLERVRSALAQNMVCASYDWARLGCSCMCSRHRRDVRATQPCSPQYHASSEHKFYISRKYTISHGFEVRVVKRERM